MSLRQINIALSKILILLCISLFKFCGQTRTFPAIKFVEDLFRTNFDWKSQPSFFLTELIRISYLVPSFTIQLVESDIFNNIEKVSPNKVLKSLNTLSFNEGCQKHFEMRNSSIS